jgi:D-psicose/D-tagatose/L-ribulose 3-epimerase
MNRIGINFWNWRSGLDEECLSLCGHAAQMGFTAVELPMTTSCLPDAAAFQAETKLLGLEVTLCAAMTAGRDISSEDETVRRETADYLAACLDTGSQLGAKLLGGPLYAGGGKRHHLPISEQRREWTRAVDGLVPIARMAGDRGMLLAIESVNRYRTSVVNTTEQALKMVRDIDSPQVGILFDTYQSCIEDDDVCHALESVLKAGKLFHFHACANHRGAPGSGHLPWDRLLGLLREYGYQGHVTMETFCPGGLDPSWYPLAPSQDLLAKQGLDYLTRWFAANTAKF